MSKEDELKKRIAQILGVGVIATGLTAAPLSINSMEDGIATSAAWAKGGEGGEGGDDGGSSGGESGGGGSSGGESGGSGSSGGESGGSGGSSSGGSGESGESGGSGSGSGRSGESGESGDDSGESGESGESGDDNGGERGRTSRTTTPVPDRFGRVVKFEQTVNSIEVRYSDRWKEEIENGRYQLKDPNGRTVVERAATFADRARLASARSRAQ